MSKAFTDEETGDAPLIVPGRAPLPDGVPNYVSTRGLALLKAELAALASERAELERLPEGPERGRALGVLAQRRAALEARIASAELVAPPPAAERDVVRFGAHVRVRTADGERGYQIVGVDEADASQGRIAFVSPLARALVGRGVGDELRVRTPRGDESLEILEIRYESESEPDVVA
jgi:transcription elongation factor GreB